ncbi:MAG: cfa1, partial [Mycobacterium sp.]|nr:cfa1 [Mycobacterium sp.]
SATMRVNRMRAVSTAARLGALGPPPAPPAAEARAHLPRDFWALLLDDHLACSSAYFTDDGQTLHEAQTAKLDLVCRELGLRPGMRLLDIGCGWGALLLYAAEHHGVHATGLTLDEEQRGFIAVRASERGLSDAVDVRVQDHREFAHTPEARGTFDAVSAVEQGGHIGERHYPAYATVMFNALKPRGRLLLQELSRPVDGATGGDAFTRRYITSDTHVRPLWQTVRHLQEAGFEVRDVEAMREHLFRTVGAWLDTFDTHYEQFIDLVGDEVARAWRLHLVGGQLALEEGRMGVDQIQAVKTTASGVSGF